MNPQKTKLEYIISVLKVIKEFFRAGINFILSDDFNDLIRKMKMNIEDFYKQVDKASKGNGGAVIFSFTILFVIAILYIIVAE